MTWVWIVLAVLAVLAALVPVVLYVLGRSMPAEHSMSRTLMLRQAPEAVYEAVADVKGWSGWDKSVKRVEEIEAGGARYVVRVRMDRNVMVLERTRHEPPRVHEMTIGDAGKMNVFSGCWRHEIESTPGGCIVRVTEEGTINWPIFRALARKFSNPAMYLERHLKRLAGKFGEEPRIP